MLTQITQVKTVLMIRGIVLKKKVEFKFKKKYDNMILKNKVIATVGLFWSFIKQAYSYKQQIGKVRILNMGNSEIVRNFI